MEIDSPRLSKTTLFLPLYSIAALCACLSKEPNHTYTRLAPDADIKFAAATVSGEVARQSGCLGLRGSDGVFRPFIFYATPDIDMTGAKRSIRLGQQTVAEGETVIAVEQITRIDDVRAVSEQATPKVCGGEGVMIQRFVKSEDGDAR